jgi:hypothetical protein
MFLPFFHHLIAKEEEKKKTEERGKKGLFSSVGRALC